MEDMGTSGVMVSSGTTLDNLVTGILVLLVKLLLIALVILLIIGAFLWIKKSFFKDKNLMQTINQNPMLRSVIGITAAILGLIFLIYLYNFLVIPNAQYNTMDGAMGSSNTGGFSGVLGITGVLTFLIKILTYVFVITLVLSLIAYLKKMIEAGGFHIFQANNSTLNTNQTKKEQQTEDPLKNAVNSDPLPVDQEQTE